MDIRVKVIPKSSKTELTGYLPDGTWKVKVAAAPEKGKANRALCEFIAEKLGVAKSKVRIIAGETSHIKQIHIETEPRPRGSATTIVLKNHTLPRGRGSECGVRALPSRDCRDHRLQRSDHGGPRPAKGDEDARK